MRDRLGISIVTNVSDASSLVDVDRLDETTTNEQDQCNDGQCRASAEPNGSNIVELSQRGTRDERHTFIVIVQRNRLDLNGNIRRFVFSNGERGIGHETALFKCLTFIGEKLFRSHDE
jgi:hypothetical protein